MSIYDISYMWYAGVACLIVVVVGAISSIIFSLAESGSWFGNPDKPVDPDLLAPGVETIFCCWPAPVKSWMTRNQIFASNQNRRKSCVRDDDVTKDEEMRPMAAAAADVEAGQEKPRS